MAALLVVISGASAQVAITVNRATHADDGVYVVTYFATDVVGNIEVTKTVRVRIDTRKPGTIAYVNVRVMQNQTVRVPTRSPTSHPPRARPP